MADNSSRNLSGDALVQILLRLPPNTRRRFRQVCRYWRKLIDKRTTTDMQRRTKIIAVGKGWTSVVDLLKPGSPRVELWQTYNYMVRPYDKMSIVGTCNGLVCPCDDLKLGGAITVTNPSTGEALRIPMVSILSYSDIYQNNNNNNNKRTGRYKVLHVPCPLDHFWESDIVHVFTLGEASWRDVHIGTNARCSLGSNSLTNVDDMMYWLTEEEGKIMSFDLKHERVTHIQPLAAPAMPTSTYRLAKVHGRLGVAVVDDYSMTVWVLEGEGWSCRYVLELQEQEKWMMRRELLVPHFAHGDCFLTLTRESWSGHFVLYRHKIISGTSDSHDGVLHIRHKERGEEVTYFPYLTYQTFSYVETKEPLSVYNAVLVHNRQWI